MTKAVLHGENFISLVDHTSIRSSSIIFLPHESAHGGSPSRSNTNDITKPYLCGFGHSRPGQGSEKEQLPKGSPSRAKTYWNITLDQYHHPSKRVNSLLSYTQACDLYSWVSSISCQQLLLHLLEYDCRSFTKRIATQSWGTSPRNRPVGTSLPFRSDDKSKEWSGSPPRTSSQISRERPTRSSREDICERGHRMSKSERWL